MPFTTISITPVPLGLSSLGCGANGEEIVGVTLGGQAYGRAGAQTRMHFQRLIITFTTSRGACGAGVGLGRTVQVVCTDVDYQAQYRLDVQPACVRTSSAAGLCVSSDPGFNTLFLTTGAQRLLDVLDPFMLSWATQISSPAGCPIVPPAPTSTRVACPLTNF
ncbi:MAG: hypothetical protein E6J90_27515 [Deltaproteobacteria bacterium]|nr:MAG: hypothetical protein E6J91_18560 [Deltaproteobacteria bacterium]TMQ13948.1 MAG: hypothetical protein E6J90_27515 [Deltaproteobacteria bacterium]